MLFTRKEDPPVLPAPPLDLAAPARTETAAFALG